MKLSYLYSVKAHMMTKHQQSANDQLAHSPESPSPEKKQSRANTQHASAHPAIALQRVRSTSSEPVNPRDILTLQRTLGNQHTIRLLEQRRQQQPTSARPTRMLQRLLTQLHTDGMTETEPPGVRAIGEGQYRDSSSVQRKTNDSFVAPQQVTDRLAARQGSGQPLSPGVRAFLEPRFRADFRGVRVHTDSEAGQLSDQIQAKAFTHGRDIYFSRGAYQPATQSGRRLLAHELTHTIQQGKTPIQRQESHPTAMHVTSASAGAIQRLITSEDLRKQAGEPKEDKKFVITWKKMSTRYKAILIALDTYHNKLESTIVARNDYDRAKQAAPFDGLLNDIRDACAIYYQDHSEDTVRTPHIVTLYRAVDKEKQAIKMVINDPKYNAVGNLGIDWDAAVAPRTSQLMKVQKLHDEGAMNKSMFHGTHSGMLDKFQGELMSGEELAKRGFVRSTGEGDFFSTGGGGEKPFISVGEGLPGMGTSLGYAMAGGMSRNYNPALYTDKDLQHEIDQLKYIIQNYDSAQIKLDNDNKSSDYKSKKQFQVLLKKLQGEADIRKLLSPHHPRRQGKSYSESTYPLLFEFDLSTCTTGPDQDIRNPRDLSLKDDTVSPRPLGGERSVYKTIDARQQGILVRVYCPYDHISEVKNKVAKAVGHRDFDVLPIEGLTNLYEPGEEYTHPVGYTLETTLDNIVGKYEMTRKTIIEGYAKGIAEGKVIDNKLLDEVGRSM